MKNFKKFIKEAHLGNPLNEENEKYDHIARAEYGKPFSLLSIAQKQEMLSYMNRETEKEFETDFERRRKGDYSDDRDDGMTDYQRRRMDEELKLGVKYELPTGETGYIMTGGSKDPKDWKFSGKSYLSVKDKLQKTKEQPGKYDGAYDMGRGKGHHIDESVTPFTRVHYIASPAPRKMLVQELEDLFGDDYRNIVTEFQDDGGYESVLMFNLTDSDIERIEDEIGDVLIGEYSLKKVKDIQETLKEDINDPVLMRTRAAQMKRDAIDKKDLENKSKRISADEAIDLRYELSILNKEREDILMRIEDIGVEMEQTAEPEGGPIADELGERLMTAEKELRAINNKIIDIKDDLGLFDMNESDLDEGTCGYTPDGEPRSKPAGPDLNEDEIPSYLTKNIIFGKAVEDSVSFNDFQKRVYGILGPKYYKLTDQGALKDFYDSIRGNKPKMESLNKSLKEALNKRLGK